MRTVRRRDEDGAAAIEFAIVAGLLFMLVFGIIDFGFGFHTWNGTANAAREGARQAAVESDPARSSPGPAPRPTSSTKPR